MFLSFLLNDLHMIGCLILVYLVLLLEWVVFHSLKSGNLFISPLKKFFLLNKTPMFVPASRMIKYR